MSGGIKVTIIGAGSAQFSAGIVRDLCVQPRAARQPRLPSWTSTPTGWR